MSVNPFSPSNIFLLLIGAALIAYLLFLWQFVQRKAAPAAIEQFKKPVTRFAVVYAAYLLALCLLAGAGFFQVATTPPRFMLFFLPMLFIIVLLMKARLDGSLSFLSLLPPVFLIATHTFRIFVEVIFIQFAADRIIPAELSIHGRNMDLFIGILAIPVALLLMVQHKLARKAALLFNLLGMLSLVNIFSIAIPSLPSAFRVYDTLYLPTYFPGIVIVFVASLALYLHILSLRQLVAQKNFSPAGKHVSNAVNEELLLH